MYYLNKIAIFAVNPLTIAGAGFAAAYFLRRRKAVCRILAALSIAWVYFWSSALAMRYLGVPLEGCFKRIPPGAYPAADAIVLLGGGVSAPENGLEDPDLNDGADRTWFAARLYKAGKAPVVIPTGVRSKESEFPVLCDLGVPPSAIAVEDEARNTEENIKFISSMVGGNGRKVLVATSAWHMKRALYMFEKYAPGIEAIPAPADWMFTEGAGGSFKAEYLLPTTQHLSAGTVLFKELAGYLAYRLFR